MRCVAKSSTPSAVGSSSVGSLPGFRQLASAAFFSVLQASAWPRGPADRIQIRDRTRTPTCRPRRRGVAGAPAVLRAPRARSADLSRREKTSDRHAAGVPRQPLRVFSDGQAPRVFRQRTRTFAPIPVRAATAAAARKPVSPRRAAAVSAGAWAPRAARPGTGVRTADRRSHPAPAGERGREVRRLRRRETQIVIHGGECGGCKPPVKNIASNRSSAWPLAVSSDGPWPDPRDAGRRRGPPATGRTASPRRAARVPPGETASLGAIGAWDIGRADGRRVRNPWLPDQRCRATTASSSSSLNGLVT